MALDKKQSEKSASKKSPHDHRSQLNVDDFFERYENSWGNPSKTLEFYASTCMAAAPGFASCTQSRDDLREALAQSFRAYTNMGVESVHVESLKEQELDDTHTMVKVHWIAKTNKEHAEPIEFDMSYILQNQGEQSKIIFFVAHQDEHELLRQSGLLPQ